MKTNFIRFFCALSLALGTLGVSIQAALAAPPSNDSFNGATLVTIGFSEVLDTKKATTDADDVQLNASGCALATDASVWYAFEGTDSVVIVDALQSNYPVGVLVGVVSQGTLQNVTCGLGTIAFFAATGTTYYVLAVDEQLDGGGNGGLLSISFNQAPPPPTWEITVNSYGKFSAKTGVATISGTYTCTNADFILVALDASQNTGPDLIFGTGELTDVGTCDGTPHPWAVNVFPQNGKFVGGKTMTSTYGASCGAFECTYGNLEQTVHLQGDGN